MPDERDLSFDQAVAELLAWRGEIVGVNVSDNRYGADGYVADFSGRLVLVDEPEVDNDSRITYFKFESGEGFAVSQKMFRSACRTKFGEIAVELDGVVLSVQVAA